MAANVTVIPSNPPTATTTTTTTTTTGAAPVPEKKAIVSILSRFRPDDDAVRRQSESIVF